MQSLKFRQIHLDFHTSEKIGGIGSQFDQKQFQEALKIGHVNSITLFSKCHHGWAYHPSKANVRHPHLDFDLLGAQIQAAHEIGVKTPVYLSAGLDEKVARQHPEWLFRYKDETTTWAKSFDEPGFHLFCFNSPYLEVLLAQIEEVVSTYEADGIFLDIVQPKPCYCQHCVNQLLAEGKDPYNHQAASDLGERVYSNYTARVREVIDKHRPGLPVFHNAGHIPKGRSDLAAMNTHLEIESLPTGGWGYDHFPLSAKYVSNGNQEFLGMTGKFHTMWGEFGGFKHPNALRYETALTIAMGGKCSVGDQLHPLGAMDLATYDLIGKAYAEVEAKEPWCDGVRPVADIAILSAESLDVDKAVSHDVQYKMDIGANRMLLQSHFLYTIIDGEADFSAYKVLILPDEIHLEGKLLDKVKAYQAGGGKLLVTGTSALSELNKTFTLDLGLKWLDHNTNSPNYYKPTIWQGSNLATSMVMYSASEKIGLTTGTSLGVMEASYFNRSTFEFCSHQHAPSTMGLSSPGMVTTGSTIYIPWKIFSEFAEIGSLHLREMVTHALDILLDGQKTLDVHLPSQAVVSYMHQEDQKRHVLHLLYGSPVLRGHSKVTGKAIEVIEDLMPVPKTLVDLRMKSEVKRVYLAPQLEDIPFKQDKGTVTIEVPSFTCHQMVVVE